jgi:hypothetical protein
MRKEFEKERGLRLILGKIRPDGGQRLVAGHEYAVLWRHRKPLKLEIRPF